MLKFGNLFLTAVSMTAFFIRKGFGQPMIIYIVTKVVELRSIHFNQPPNIIVFWRQFVPTS